MSGNRVVWGHVRTVLCTFPEHLVVCGAGTMAKGRCMQVSVTPGGRLRKDLCMQEFKALWSCFVSVAKKTLKGSR
eukprot:bmy_18255T0